MTSQAIGGSANYMQSTEDRRLVMMQTPTSPLKDETFESTGYEPIKPKSSN